MTETKNINSDTKTIELNMNNLIKDMHELLPTIKGNKFLYTLTSIVTFGIFPSINHHNVNKVILELNDSISAIDLKFKSELSLIIELNNFLKIDSKTKQKIEKITNSLSSFEEINLENRNTFSKMINSLVNLLDKYINVNEFKPESELDKKIKDFIFLNNKITENKKIYNESITNLQKLASKYPTNIIIGNKKILNYDFF